MGYQHNPLKSKEGLALLCVETSCAPLFSLLELFFFFLHALLLVQASCLVTSLPLANCHAPLCLSFCPVPRCCSSFSPSPLHSRTQDLLSRDSGGTYFFFGFRACGRKNKKNEILTSKPPLFSSRCFLFVFFVFFFASVLLTGSVKTTASMGPERSNSASKRFPL